MKKKTSLVLILLLSLSFYSRGQVDLWEESTVIPIYETGPPEINPPFT